MVARCFNPVKVKLEFFQLEGTNCLLSKPGDPETTRAQGHDFGLWHCRVIQTFQGAQGCRAKIALHNGLAFSQLTSKGALNL